MLTGVRQGYLLSPLLFLVVFDWVTRQAFGRSARGIQWQLTQRLEDLEHADDLALLTHRLQDMRSKMEDLMGASERTGLRVNSDKIKIMKVMSINPGRRRKNWARSVRGGRKFPESG